MKQHTSDGSTGNFGLQVRHNDRSVDMRIALFLKELHGANIIFSQDQRMAMAWAHKNIQHFGGDPNRSDHLAASAHFTGSAESAESDQITHRETCLWLSLLLQAPSIRRVQRRCADCSWCTLSYEIGPTIS